MSAKAQATCNLTHTDLCALVGQNLRRYRLLAGLTQEELAHRAGLDRTYLSDIERGIRNPTLLMMRDLADSLKLGVIDLLEGSERKEPAGPRTG